MKVPVKVKAGCRQRKRIKKDIQEAVCNGILQANAQMNSSASEEKKIGFWRTIWCIIKGKGSDGSRYTTAIFTSLLGTFFNTLAFLGLMVFIVIICSTVNQIRTWSWNCESIWGNVIQLISTVVFLILVFLFALMFRGASNDMKQEKDRNYIIALFSGVVSFAALIVALVALVKG